MKKALLLLGMFSLSLWGFAQVSKQQAIDIVMESVVGNDFTEVNIYMEPLSQTNPYYVTSPYDSIQSPYPNYWLFFIDDMPDYLWYHACRFVFVNASNGMVQTVAKQKPPIRLFNYYEEVYLSIDDHAIPIHINNCHASAPVADTNNGKYAVLFCSDYSSYWSYWNSISHMYCALLEQGYPKGNIYVLAHDGTVNTNPKMDLDSDGLPDILPVPCDSVSLCAIFDTLTQTMVDGDFLYVLAMAHGGPDENHNMKIDLWGEEENGEPFLSTSFANLFHGLRCSAIIVNIQACFAGCLVSDLINAFPSNVKYSILTCINDRPYQYDAVFASKTGMHMYPFLSCSALRGQYPDSCALWDTIFRIGNNPYFSSELFSKEERNYDVTWGNNNGIHEIKEIIQFCKYDNRNFDSIIPLNSYNCGFVEDLLSIRGITGNVTHNQTVSGSYHIEDNLCITNGASLELADNTKFFLFNSTLTIGSGTTIELGDNTAIVARSGNCRVYISGDIDFGDNVSFCAEDGCTLDVVFCNPSTQQDAFAVSFRNCTVSSYSNSNIVLDHCIFDRCQITPTGTFSITNCTLTESSIMAATPSYTIYKLATVSNCSINNLNKIGISLANYMDYYIYGNTITANNNPGISLSTCGRNVALSPKISNNVVTGCSFGVLAYSSRGEVYNNQITGNGIGLHLDNISNISVCGSQTGDGQRISDNYGIEVYVSGNSFPSNFKYNRIVDEDNLGNPNDPLLKYSIDSESAPLLYDIEYNYWGSCFSATDDLFPYDIFDYDPIWNGRGCVSYECQLYQSAEDALSSGRYEAADSLYRLVISSYPNSNYAQSAMKQMLFMENLLQNGYENLKGFYLQISDTALVVLADNLSNKCDEMMKKWPDAIAWYENVIQTPASYEDSVYAVIDLGNLYLEMDSTRNLIGRMPQYRPMSKQAHVDNTMALLATIPRCDNSISSDLAPIEALSADYYNNTIILTWAFPETYQPETENLSWSGEMSNQYGSFLHQNVYEDHAHRYDTLDLRNYVGWRVKSIGIIPLDSMVEYYAAVWIKEGNDFSLLYSEPLTDTIHFSENTHELNEDIYIDSDKEYLFGWRELCDPSLQGWSGFYNAVDDKGPFFDGKGNMSRVLYEGWHAWPHYANWCITTVLESPTGEVLTLSQKNEETLTGYRVYKDGQLMEEIGRRFQTYSFDNSYSIGETVTYSVTAMYGDAESEPVSVAFAYDGVNDSNDTGNVTINPNPANGLVRIDGMQVAELRVCNILGQTLKTIRNSNTFSVSGLPAGLYLLHMTDGEGATVTRRIVVK